MNFYPHHIGDYLTATVHLSWMEDCAYRRLLDLYYSREKCLPVDKSQVCRLARAASKDERQAVDVVLDEFFELTESGWSHRRCNEEIEKARVSSERSKANGMKGGRPSKPKPTDNPDGTQQVISGLAKQNPDLTQSEPDPKAPNTNPNTNTNTSVAEATASGAGGADPELTKAELWTAGKSILAEQGMPIAQCGSFVGKLVKDYGDGVVIDAVRAAVVQRPADVAQYLIASCQHAIGQRKPVNRQEALEARNRALADEMIAEFNAKGAPIETV